VKRIFLILHWLNYDTAFGAVVTSLFITQNLGSNVPDIAFLALFIAVLAIYNFDHLLDAQRIRGVAQSGRHRYYQEHFKTLSIYQLALLILLIFVSWYVPENIARAGIVLAVISLIYFLLLFIILPKKFFIKEVLISIVFVSGLVLAPAVTGPYLPLASDYLLWGEIFLLALTNTFILAWFDYDIDAKEGHVSIAQLLGKKSIYRISYLLLGVLGLLIVISLILFSDLKSQVIVSAMSIPLLASLGLSRQFRKNEFYRIASDAIFIIPIISLI
jgi:4-hydroxybenzoate polyprenyltransferase